MNMGFRLEWHMFTMSNAHFIGYKLLESTQNDSYSQTTPNLPSSFSNLMTL